MSHSRHTRLALLLTAVSLLTPMAATATATAASAAPAATSSTGTVATSLTLDSPRLRARDGGGIDLRSRLTSRASDDTGHKLILEMRAPGKAWRMFSSTTTSGDPRRNTDGAGIWAVRALHEDYSFRVVHPEQTVRGQHFAATTSRVINAAVGGPRTFTVADNGRNRAMSFDLIAGDKVVFTADECRSCGYSWSVTRKPDARYVRTAGDAYAEPAATPGSVGGGGFHQFAWQAEAAAGPKTPGRTGATLSYDPPGSDATADHTVTAAFVVFA